MNATIQGFRCWSAVSIQETVFSDIGTLAADSDAVFLAAHTPVELEHVKGSETGSHATGEAQVLDALLHRVGDSARNTLVAVTGASGSGKSHVVRWVHAHLPKDDSRYTILYVPRAVQTIRDLLRSIVKGLPGVEGLDLLERVDRAVSGKSAAELQDLVIAQMRHALNWTLEDQASFDGESEDEASLREERNNLLGERDAEGRRRDGLADLLELPAVSRTLSRQEGEFRQLIESYFAKISRRDQSEAIFSRADLPLRESGVRGSLAGRPALRELWEIVARNPEDAISLLEESLRAALPETLGLRSSNGETLDTLFRESRKALRQQGRELVLIFEDLAQFGLVDGELYDQFVTPPGEDLAPLRVVFAVTDGPYAKMERTVRTRVEHEFRVGGSALADPGIFIGRYLNLVRTGRADAQERWRRRTSSESADWMTNACDTREEGAPCRVRDSCHAAFGSVTVPELGEVGLYPYNAAALTRATTHVGEEATPREVLDSCISTNLVEADIHIGRGTYPHERTKQQFDFFTRRPKDAVLAANPSTDPERAYRALVIWGDEEPLVEGVLDAFRLRVDRATSITTTPALEEPKPASAPTPPRSNRPNPFLPLFQWQNEVAELPEHEIAAFRTALHELTLSRLDMDQYLIHVKGGRGQRLLDEIFNVTSFSIEGARGRRAGEKAVRFEVGRSAEDVQLLVAARWFREHGHFVPDRGNWDWPGYDPARLMIDLEVRLDDWAHVVRSHVLSVARGGSLAKDAVALRAIALAATGIPIDRLPSANAVLTPHGDVLPAGESWRSTNEVAKRVLVEVKADEFIGEFAAVRQGETGRPQLVDSFDLDAAVSEAVSDPQTVLRRIADESPDPVLQRGAKELQSAVLSSLDAQLANYGENALLITNLLEGASPSNVGRVALEVGKSARDSGFFRPSAGWYEFERASERLISQDHIGTDSTVVRDLNGVVSNQSNIRSVNSLAQDLRVVRAAMEATREECERSGSEAGDATRLRAEVKRRVSEIAFIVDELSAVAR